MFSTSLFFATSFAAGFNVLQLEEPIAEVLASLNLKAGTKQLVTLDQMQKGLASTDYSDYVNKRFTNSVSAPKNETCWSYDYGSTPAGCPSSGWMKFEKIEFEKANVGGAGVSVDANNHVGLTVTNVTMMMKPTKFTVQPKGLFTVACTGVLKGVISGAAAAVEAAVDAGAEGVPIIGEQAAMPVNGLVKNVSYQLDGLCGALEELLEGALDIIGMLLEDVIGKDLPMIIEDLMKVVFGNAVTQPGLTMA